MKEPQGIIYNNGELDLMELLLTFWRKKLTIMFITILCASFGMAYTFIKKPTYEAKAYLLPPALEDIGALNYGRSKAKEFLPPLEVKEVYALFIRNLLSEKAKRIFFQKVFLPSLSLKTRNKSPMDTLYNQFNQQLIIQEASNKYSVTIRANSSTQASEWVKRYVSLVEGNTIQDLLRTIHEENKNMASDLKLRIDLARKVIKERRMDRLIQLKEALNIAEAIGLDKLRTLQSKLDLYNNIEIDTKKIRVFRFDSGVEVPDLPIAPKRLLIEVGSIMTGLVLGLLIVMLWTGFLQLKTQHLKTIE